jgi:hypothetical protein
VFFARCGERYAPIYTHKHDKGTHMTPRILNDPELDAKLQKAIEGKEHEVEIDLICTTLVLSRGVVTERLVLE